MQPTKLTTDIEQFLQITIGFVLSSKQNQDVYMIESKILITGIQLHRLGVIKLCQLKHTPLLLHATSCSISHRTVRVLLYQTVNAIVSLGIMLIFLIEQSQTELRLEVARNKYQKILII